MAQVSKNTLNLSGRLLDLSTPRIMGILNATPDSFYQGSRVGRTLGEVLSVAGSMLDAGATFLDIGGYSTRPGASEVSEAEELDRVIPVVGGIREKYPDALLSIDTFRSKVARYAVEAGANLVNDVSGGTLDAAMFETVAELGVPYILMHMRGTPQTMGGFARYDDLMEEVTNELAAKLMRLRSLGVADVVVDPGFGFAKNATHNFRMLRSLAQFAQLDAPLLVGVSRKSMVWRTLGVSPDEALNGSTVLHTVALMKGVQIIRVHDVAEAAEAVKLVAVVEGESE